MTLLNWDPEFRGQGQHVAVTLFQFKYETMVPIGVILGLYCGYIGIMELKTLHPKPRMKLERASLDRASSGIWPSRNTRTQNPTKHAQRVQQEYGVYGDPYSIYLRGTINPTKHGQRVQQVYSFSCCFWDQSRSI